MSVLSQAIAECLRTGVSQKLTKEEVNVFVQDMQVNLTPKIEAIRRSQLAGYAACKELIVR